MTRLHERKIMDSIPRRSQLDKMIPVEMAIYDLVQEVEEMPPSPILTEAVNLLQKAREKVADWEDGRIALNSKTNCRKEWDKNAQGGNMLLYKGDPDEFYEFVKGGAFSLVTAHIFSKEVTTRGYTISGTLTHNKTEYPLYRAGIQGSINLFKSSGMVGCAGIHTQPELHRELFAIRDSSVTLPEIVGNMSTEESCLTYVVKGSVVVSFPVNQIRNDFVNKVCDFYKVS